jgi:ketosteroid isomerase-like protein
MSQENVEVVRRLFAAFNRRDLKALAADVHPNFEFVSVLTAVDAGTTYRGPRAWTLYFEAMDETWKDWHAEDVRLFDGGDELVVGVFRIVGTGVHSNAPVDREVGLVYRFRQGQLWRMRSYLDPQQALEAVGLSE